MDKRYSIARQLWMAAGVGAFGVPVVFLGIFYFLPLAGIIERSVVDTGIFSLSDKIGYLFSTRTLGIVWFTFWQATMSTLLSLCAALPIAYVVSTFAFSGRKIALTLATLPFVLPTIVVAAAFQSLFGASGMVSWITIDQSVYLIILAHVFYNMSVMIRIISAYWSYVQNQILEAGAMLGASPLKVFLYVTLPLLRPAIWSSSLLVFLFCFSSFGVILILGGPRFSTIEVEIYRQAVHLFNLSNAAILAVFQILFSFGAMWLYARLQSRASVLVPQTEKRSLRPASTPVERSMVLACCGFILFFCMMPTASLVVKSLWYDGRWSLVFYQSLFSNLTGSVFYVSPFRAASNSLIFAMASLVMASVLGLSAALFVNSCPKRLASLVDPLFMLPLATSAVILGFGIIITLDRPPLNLRTSWFIIPAAHTLIAFPFVVRAILPSVRAMAGSLKEAAQSLGATPFQVLVHLELPILARSLAAGALFAFTISLGEFGATLFIARPEHATLPLAIYRSIGQPGALNHGQAMALSTILMVVTFAGFWLIDTLRSTRESGF